MSQSFCTTVKFGVVFLKSVGNNYDKFVSRIFDERITPKNMHNNSVAARKFCLRAKVPLQPIFGGQIFQERANVAVSF